MFRENEDPSPDGPLESTRTSFGVEYDSFTSYIREATLAMSVSLNPDSHAGTDLVGLMFNVIVGVLFGGSIIAAWLLT